MKRLIFISSLLFSVCFIATLSTVKASEGQGISYYKAGFQQVAKPLLLAELNTNSVTKAETSFYLGNIYFAEGKADSAAYYFNVGNTANPLNSVNAVGLAMLKMKSDLPAAELMLKSTLKLKGNAKNVNLMIAIANAYLVNGIKDKAVLYKDKAKKLKPKYAPVFVLMGDIELANGSVGGACSNYEQAIYFDDTNKEAYIKYARAYRNANSALAIQKLGVLQQKDPSFKLADKELADIYYSINKFDMAAPLYESYLNSGNSNVLDKTRYAMTLFFKGDFAKSLDVANQGLVKEPRNPAFNRLVMYNNVSLAKFNEALLAADKFFNQSDNPDISYFDYTYYGQALRNTKQFDLAIEQFQKALKLDSTQQGFWKDISDMYSEKGDYVSAISSYKTYLLSLPEEKVTAEVYNAYGKLYYGQGTSATTIDPLVKKAALLKADSLFAQVATLEPTGYRGNFWRARANSALDPETTQGLARPFYEQTATFIEAKADAARYNAVLIECYSYLGYAALMKKDNNLSISFWDKILVIDPNNATAKKAKEGIQKTLKGKK